MKRPVAKLDEVEWAACLMAASALALVLMLGHAMWRSVADQSQEAIDFAAKWRK